MNKIFNRLKHKRIITAIIVAVLLAFVIGCSFSFAACDNGKPDGFTVFAPEGIYAQGEIYHNDDNLNQRIEIKIHANEMFFFEDVSVSDYLISGVTKDDSEVILPDSFHLDSDDHMQTWYARISVIVKASKYTKKCNLIRIDFKVKDKTVTYNLDIDFIYSADLNTNFYSTYNQPYAYKQTDDVWEITHGGQYTYSASTLKRIYSLSDSLKLSDNMAIRYVSFEYIDGEHINTEISGDYQRSNIDFYINKTFNHMLTYTVDAQIEEYFDNLYIATMVVEVEDEANQIVHIVRTAYFYK